MNALVKAQNLSYKINDKKLFQGISFELLKGKALHIQGENGSGKTTLLRMVCGLTKPTKGDLITYTDKEVCFIGHKNAIKQYLNVEDNLVLMNLNNHHDSPVHRNPHLGGHRHVSVVLDARGRRRMRAPACRLRP